MKRPWTSRRRVFKSHLRPPQRCHVSCCRLFSADCVRKAASAGTGHRVLRCQPFLDKQSREGWNTRGERCREVSSLQSLLVFYLKRRTQTTFWGEGQPGEEDLNIWKQNERSFVKKHEKIQGSARITVVTHLQSDVKWVESRGCGSNSFTRGTLIGAPQGRRFLPLWLNPGPPGWYPSIF